MRPSVVRLAIMAKVTSKRKTRRCSVCTTVFRPKPYQRKCKNCSDYEFWKTKAGLNILGHVQNCKWQGQLEQVNLHDALQLIKQRNKFSGVQVRDISIKGEKAKFETSITLELELSHLYPASKGGLLTADNLAIAPKSMNRDNGNTVYPVGVYDDTGDLVSKEYCKQWIEDHHDLNLLKKQYNLSTKSKRAKPTAEYSGEVYNYDDVLKAEALRLNYKLKSLGWSGWVDLLEGRLEKVTEAELLQRSEQELLLVELNGEYPLLLNDEIHNAIVSAKGDKDSAIQALDEKMNRDYPPLPSCNCDVLLCNCNSNNHLPISDYDVYADNDLLESLGFVTGDGCGSKNDVTNKKPP